MPDAEQTVQPSHPAERPLHSAPGIFEGASSKPRRFRRFGLTPTQPMSEAGGAIMAFHFNRLRDYAAPAAEGNEDAIHDMRVATRRLRAALRIAGPYYKRKVGRSFRATLKELADDLGAVRDMDVLIAHGEKFDHAQPEGAPRLDTWLDHLRSRREAAQRDLIEYLSGERFQKLLETFQAFVDEPGAAAASSDHPAGSPRVCDVVAPAVWQQYSAVRHYEASNALSLEAMHALRIETKRLRYALEFFQEVLGPGAASLIEMTVHLQDHLGELHDVDVASALVREYLADRIQQGDMGSSPALAAAFAYQAAAQAEIADRLRQFPDLWHPIVDKSFRRVLARLVSNV